MGKWTNNGHHLYISLNKAANLRLLQRDFLVGEAIPKNVLYVVLDKKYVEMIKWKL